MWARNCPVILPKFRLPPKFRDLLHAANLRHGTDGFTSPPKEGVLRIIFALKILTVSDAFESANLGTKGQHATPRPPKPLNKMHENQNLLYIVLLMRHNIVVFINSISPMAIYIYIYIWTGIAQSV